MENSQFKGAGSGAIEPRPDRPWKQQPGEPDKAFEGFSAYLGLGSGNRSLLKAFRQYKGLAEGEGPKAAPGNFTRWSKAYDWPARARAWDLFEDGLAAIRHVEELKELRQWVAERGKELQALLDEELGRISQQGARGKSFLSRSADRTPELQRLASAYRNIAVPRLLALGALDEELPF